MTNVIIYNQDSGIVAVIIPTQEALATFTIEEIAKKDVPLGKPFKIINLSDIPSDRSARNAWVVDDTYLTDGIGERLI